MYAEVKIGDKTVPMLCKASTNVYFEQVFSKDPILLQADKDMTPGEQISFTQKLAFIMAKQAEYKGDRAKLAALSAAEYVDWLDEFDFIDLQHSLNEVMTLYVSSSKGKSVGK